MDEDRLAKAIVFWLRATVIALICHGMAVLLAAGVVAATGVNVANRLNEMTTFAKEQVAIFNGYNR